MGSSGDVHKVSVHVLEEIYVISEVHDEMLKESRSGNRKRIYYF